MREIHLLVTGPPVPRPGRELSRRGLLRGRSGRGLGRGARAGHPGGFVRSPLPPPSPPRPLGAARSPVTGGGPGAFPALPGAAGWLTLGQSGGKSGFGGAERECELSSNGTGLPEGPRPAFPRGGGAGGVGWGGGEAVPGPEAGAAVAVGRRRAAVSEFPTK